MSHYMDYCSESNWVLHKIFCNHSWFIIYAHFRLWLRCDLNLNRVKISLDIDRIVSPDCVCGLLLLLSPLHVSLNGSAENNENAKGNQCRTRSGQGCDLYNYISMWHTHTHAHTGSNCPNQWQQEREHSDKLNCPINCKWNEIIIEAKCRKSRQKSKPTTTHNCRLARTLLLN